MIQFAHVTKQYEGEPEPVFEDFSAVIEDGEFILLTGESGVGKSSFIRLLLKEVPATSGEIVVLDQKLSALSDKQIPFYRRKLGVVFQDPRLIPGQTAYQNVELARRIVGGTKKENRRVITSLFVLLGITHLYNRYPEELSGGEKQKVCLARALVNFPAVLLADEPTGNLSPSESRELMQLFELVHRQGITVIVATHDRESARGLAYREIALGEAKAREGIVSDSVRTQEERKRSNLWIDMRAGAHRGYEYGQDAGYHAAGQR